MDSWLQDLRYAWRKLLDSPGFTLVAVLTLAVGIGANTAIFTVVDGVLLEPLPYERPQELVFVWNRMVHTGMPKAPLSAPDFADLVHEARSFTALAASDNVSDRTLAGDGAPEQIQVASVTADYFDVLGVDPFLGRRFEAADGAPFPPDLFQQPNPEIPPTAVMLSYDFWRRRYAGDPAVLGRALRINGAPFTVVGVLGPDFSLLMPPDAGMPPHVDAWIPFRFDLAQAARDNQWLRVIGRLAPGVTRAQAQAEMDALAERFREQFAFHRNMGMEMDLRGMQADVVAHVRPVLWALLGAVGFVLLIACANVANLMLARATLRGREMAVRSALGASRWRLLRQVLIEGALLALLGGAAGVGLAYVGLQILTALHPADLPRLDALALDARVLVFTLVATATAALVSALAPAFDLSGAHPQQALQERGGDGGAARLRLRGALVVAEVALSLVLLVGAALMLRSFLYLAAAQPGFEPRGVLTYKLNLNGPEYGDPAARTGFFQRMREGVGALPGVEAVGAVYPLPLSGRLWTGPWGRPGDSAEDWSKNEANFRVTTPGFFEAMGARLLAGRTFEVADDEEQRPVVVIDDRLAARAFPGRPAVGEHLGMDLLGNPLDVEVVGVVAHMRHDSLAADGRETIYFPQHLFPWMPMYVAVRTAGEPAGLLAPVRRQVRALDPGVPVYGERTMAGYVDEALAPTRFAMLLLGLFAAVAVLLAAVGLFGVIAYSVRQRRREIGIRLALGAPAASILRLVLVRGVGLIALGVVLGLAAAAMLTRVLRSQLYGVSATDPWTFAAIAALLAVLALLASWLPARRAMEVDPVQSLRAE